MDDELARCVRIVSSISLQSLVAPIKLRDNYSVRELSSHAIIGKSSRRKLYSCHLNEYPSAHDRLALFCLITHSLYDQSSTTKASTICHPHGYNCPQREDSNIRAYAESFFRSCFAFGSSHIPLNTLNTAIIKGMIDHQFTLPSPLSIPYNIYLILIVTEDKVDIPKLDSFVA
jgi:hypothetical protein